MYIKDLTKDTLHHASLISGGDGDLPKLREHISKILNIKFGQNPDIMELTADALTVEFARKVVERSKANAISGGPKVIIVSFSQVTREAQNILLKSLEEPSENTYIFILTPNTGILLPTVLSRCMIVDIASGETQGSAQVEEFIKANMQDRLKIIAELAKAKDKATMMRILSGLEQYLTNHKPKNVPGAPWNIWRQQVEAVLNAQKYIRDKGAMSKMLMESVALVL